MGDDPLASVTVPKLVTTSVCQREDSVREADMEAMVTVLLNAMTLISILMLVGLGLAIIFGLMGVINMAHGDFITIGAFSLAMVQGFRGQLLAGALYRARDRGPAGSSH